MVAKVEIVNPGMTTGPETIGNDWGDLKYPTPLQKKKNGYMR